METLSYEDAVVAPTMNAITPSYFHIYVNNIQGRENLAKTPEKWGKKRLKIFP
jgi:hypothetical protein